MNLDGMNGAFRFSAKTFFHWTLPEGFATLILAVNPAAKHAILVIH